MRANCQDDRLTLLEFPIDDDRRKSTSESLSKYYSLCKAFSYSVVCSHEWCDSVVQQKGMFSTHHKNKLVNELIGDLRSEDKEEIKTKLDLHYLLLGFRRNYRMMMDQHDDYGAEWESVFL